MTNVLVTVFVMTMAEMMVDTMTDDVTSWNALSRLGMMCLKGGGSVAIIA